MSVNIGSLYADLNLNTSAFTANMKKASGELNSGVARMKRATNSLESSFKSLNQSAMALQTGLRGVVGAAVVGMGIQALKTADSYNVLQARIKQVTKETGDYAGVSRTLAGIAADTGTRLEDNVDVFQRLEMGAKDLGKSNQDVLKLVKVVDELGVIGGSSGEAMQAGLLQFGQAMSAGIVRAEEFNSIVENMPALANRIAEGMGKSTGQLRQMVISGKLLSKDVFDALLKQSGAIQKDFDEMPQTMQRGWNSLMQTIQSTLGSIDEGGGFTESIGAGLDNIAKKTKENEDGFKRFGAFIKKSAEVAGTAFTILLQTFAIFANTIADTIIRIFELVIDSVVSDINHLTGLLNKIPNVAIPQLEKSTHMTGFEDEVKKLIADSEKNGYGKKLSQQLSDLVNGRFGGEGQKTSDKVSDKGGPPAPIVDPNAEANAKKIAEFIKDLNAETAATKRLLAARKIGEDQYERTKMLIEAENEVRNKNLKLTKAQEQALIKQAYANRVNQKTVDFVGVRTDLNQQIKDTMALTKARLEGHDALLKEQDKQSVESQAKSMTTGMNATQKMAIQFGIANKIITERVNAFTEIKTQLKEQIADNETLLNAQKVGTVEYQKQQMILEAMNAAKQQGGNLSEAEIKQLAQMHQQNAQLQKDQELLDFEQQLQQEINNQKKLTEARKQGTEAYNKMTMAISAQNVVHQRNLDLFSEDGQAIYNLAFNLELAQYQFEKLQDAMGKFGEIGQQVSGAITDAFGQMIFQGGKFSDVLKQLALDMAKLIWQETVAKPAAKGLGSLFANIGGKIATSLLTRGTGIKGNVGDFGSGAVQYAAIGADTGPGQPFIVGEKGPELFVPRSAGNIVPHGEFGTSGGNAPAVTVVFQISTGVAPTVRAELMKMMPDIEKRTTSAVLTASSRGGKMSQAMGRKS